IESLNKKYLLSVLFSECKGEDRVIQPTEDVFASEGDTVTLDCTFETTRTSPTLFWYRQKCNDFPRYMLKSYSDKAEKASEFQTDRFNAAINRTSVPLKIQKLQLTDSAVYYCALQPTRVPPVGLNLVVEMGLWLWIILVALLLGERQRTYSDYSVHAYVSDSQAS
uniref:Ig-like domain-containing protein n=1 Tax=Labrus bergylta TaxID=56723 RepID=A0A3Q3LT19_9LABR